VMTQEQRLRDFAQRQREAAARPVRRGKIDPRVMLPDLETLLRIDREAEAAAAAGRAVAGPDVAQDATAAVRSTAGGISGRDAGRGPAGGRGGRGSRFFLGGVARD